MTTEATYQVNHTRTLVVVGLMIGCMVLLVSFSVPLYRIFCQVTGFGGTTQQAESSNNVVLDREMTVLFNADINQNLSWYFKPVQRKVKVKIGEEALIFYRAVNNSSETLTGTATFNVTPYKAGKYFNKIDCFCFTEQTLKAGETADMPVTFFIDPEIENDLTLNEIKEITLSYTFFRSDEG